ncbi:MAG: HD domain-containing protein [Anaerovoracaceae bacterium]
MINEITSSKCMDMLKEYGTPKHVINHCKGVSKVATRISERLNTKGYKLNTNLCTCSGLLHDMARVEDHHGEVAATYLETLGYQDMADIIKVHMKHSDFNPIETISELDIVCISDRVVLEGTYVGLKKRLEYIKKKANHTPETLKRLKVVEDRLYEYIYELEGVMDISLDELLEGIDEKD